MRVLVDVGHPAHVHFYKHAVWRLQEQGHEVLISARDKDVTLELLDHYGFPYRTLSSMGRGLAGLAREFVQREWALLRLIRQFNPDVVTEVGGLFVAPVCRLANKPSVVFTDTEHVALDRYLTFPLASVICTPDCFKRALGKRHLRYAGFQELAYVHPSTFRADHTVLDELGVSAEEPFVLVRFVAWKAGHDLGHKGLSPALRREIVGCLARYGKVFVSSEGELPGELEPFRISISAQRMHDALAFASLYFGEGATMATEAALLGTPAVYVSPLVGAMGNFEALMHQYQLVAAYCDPAEALQQAVALLERTGTKAEWNRRRSRLLEDKIDVTQFLWDTLERYAGRA